MIYISSQVEVPQAEFIVFAYPSLLSAPSHSIAARETITVQTTCTNQSTHGVVIPDVSLLPPHPKSLQNPPKVRA